MILLSLLLSVLFHLYTESILKGNIHYMLLNIKDLCTVVLRVRYKTMESVNTRKLGSMKLSLYESRSEFRRRRRMRTIFTKTQIGILENQFKICQYADPFTLQMMSNNLSLDIDPIKVWFKNRRRRERIDNKRQSCSTLIDHSDNKCSPLDEQVGITTTKFETDQSDKARRVIKNMEHFNFSEIKTNMLPCMENGFVNLHSSTNHNNNNNNKTKAPDFVERDLTALCKDDDTEIVKTIASLCSEYGVFGFHNNNINFNNNYYANINSNSYINGKNSSNSYAGDFLVNILALIIFKNLLVY